MSDDTRYYQFGNEFISAFYESALSNKKNEDYDISEEYFKELYLNEIDGIYDDPIFEDKEATSAKDILIVGDTITHPGCPPDYKYKWPVLLAKELDLEFHSVSIMGGSVMNQVRRTIAYVEKYGAPKYIFALFSSFNRIEIPKNKNFYQYKRNASDKEFNGTNIRQACIISDIQDKSLFVPYDAEFALSQELPQFYSSVFIDMLEAYCLAKNIKLVWSTWSSNQDLIIKKVKSISSNKYRNYISIENGDWKVDYDLNKYIYLNDSCHSEFSDHEEFDFFFTEPDNVSKAFWGIHRHIHIKDLFLKEIGISNE